jgi:hypothetical protein
MNKISYKVIKHDGAWAIDRQYFDTAEDKHTTEIVKVSVDSMTCLGARPTQTLSNAQS